ncbi:MAG: DUF411 domain-containing protein [Marinobacter sp.]|nr:DUF411 domain-containing protein [Marinobacter sp.]
MPIYRFALIITLKLASLGLFAHSAAASDTITVYKTPTCGCCTDWVDHLKADGFDVKALDITHQALNQVKEEAGLRPELASCHTAFVGGYVIEGHVPAADIRRLLAESPDALGIAVPGMPMGSPGMEFGDRQDPYAVLLFNKEGQTRIFSQYP